MIDTPRSRASGPSFLFVGAGRAGSSWFFEILRQHPGVFMPPNKGTFFFSRHPGMGVSWYEGFFPGDCRARVAGEVCEDYIANPEALRRIRDYRPAMRLICSLRNPYERAISAWRFMGRSGEPQGALSEEGERRPHLFFQGYYGTQLALLRSLFPDRQILVVFFEELLADPAAVARRVYEFVGVDPHFVPRSLRERVNATASPRWPAVARVVNEVHMRSWGRSRALSNLVGWVKRVRPFRTWVRAALYRERPQSEDWRRHHVDLPAPVVLRYEEEIVLLERMLRRDLSGWRAPPLVVQRAKDAVSAAQHTSRCGTRVVPAAPTARPAADSASG
jgi:Sulfotransferase domain